MKKNIIVVVVDCRKESPEKIALNIATKSEILLVIPESHNVEVTWVLNNDFATLTSNQLSEFSNSSIVDICSIIEGSNHEHIVLICDMSIARVLIYRTWLDNSLPDIQVGNKFKLKMTIQKKLSTLRQL